MSCSVKRPPLSFWKPFFANVQNDVHGMGSFCYVRRSRFVLAFVARSWLALLWSFFKHARWVISSRVTKCAAERCQFQSNMIFTSIMTDPIFLSMIIVGDQLCNEWGLLLAVSCFKCSKIPIVVKTCDYLITTHILLSEAAASFFSEVYFRECVSPLCKLSQTRWGRFCHAQSRRFVVPFAAPPCLALLLSGIKHTCLVILSRGTKSVAERCPF